MLYIVLDGAGLVSWDGTEAHCTGTAAATAGMAGEETKCPDATTARLVFLQDLHDLQGGRWENRAF